MRTLPNIAFSLTVILWPCFALAAPFCVTVQSIAPQCDYYDVVECSRRATQLGGVCSANSSELTLAPGNGHYCLVDSSRVSQCIYADRATCENDAQKKGAVCIDNSPPLGVQTDPYRLNPERNY